MRRTSSSALALALALAGALLAPSAASADRGSPKTPPSPAVAKGFGGAVSSVDAEASAVGLKVLRRGGNAVDAAVATAAALGVTEPYSAGVGGGGFFVVYDAQKDRVRTLDGRETAPATMPRDAFINPRTDKPYRFTPELVTSGVSVGTPGTPATWTTALKRWGSLSLSEALAPAVRLARKGFVVDQTFRQQTKDNVERFRQFTSTKRLFLRGGLPEVGSRFRNRDLARTYVDFGRQGRRYFYDGAVARDIVEAVRRPPLVRNPTLPVPTGFLTRRDFSDYEVRAQKPTRTDYRGHQVFGMAPASSGGIAVGEALNILERFDLDALDDAAVLHHYLEASALAFADRAAYVGDDAYVDVPQRALLSERFAAERACRISSTRAKEKPVASGDVRRYDGRCGRDGGQASVALDTENESTTHLTVADRWGNVVAYTLTIEQTGGSGIVVPGRGFLLNNELTDFSPVFEKGDPNRIQPGKRPRSSMSPTIVLRDGKPFVALGSPGGSTIITTVLQTLVNLIDRDLSLPAALRDPRASERNDVVVTAEPEFIDRYGAQLRAYGHELEPAGDAFTSEAEIGAMAAIGFGPGRMLLAAAEPERRGGGAARVVRPQR